MTRSLVGVSLVIVGVLLLIVGTSALAVPHPDAALYALGGGGLGGGALLLYAAWRVLAVAPESAGT